VLGDKTRELIVTDDNGTLDISQISEQFKSKLTEVAARAQKTPRWLSVLRKTTLGRLTMARRWSFRATIVASPLSAVACLFPFGLDGLVGIATAALGVAGASLIFIEVVKGAGTMRHRQGVIDGQLCREVHFSPSVGRLRVLVVHLVGSTLAVVLGYAALLSSVARRAPDAFMGMNGGPLRSTFLL
jgi:hypothetical protein